MQTNKYTRARGGNVQGRSNVCVYVGSRAGATRVDAKCWIWTVETHALVKNKTHSKQSNVQAKKKLQTKGRRALKET
jgi:hypothetical protein